MQLAQFINNLLISSLILLLSLFARQSLAQQAAPTLMDSAQCVVCISKMGAFKFSYTDLTPGLKVVYKIYAIKQKKIWFLMLTDGIELMPFYAKMPSKKKKEKLILLPAPPLMAEAICQSFQPKMLKNKPKTKWVGDQRLDNYYMAKRKTRRLINEVLMNLAIIKPKKTLGLPLG